MITKGIARLLPELMKKAKGAKGVTKKGQELLSPAMQGSNRIKKHYSDAFNEARARINNMDMSPAQKDAAVEKLRTFMRNQHSEEMMRTANLGDFAVTPLPALVKQGLAFATGGALGYGVGANKNAIADMLKSTKLPTQDEQAKFLGSLPEGFEDLQLLPHQEDWFQEDEPEFDLALDEEPLEQGGIGDLLLWNRVFGD